MAAATQMSQSCAPSTTFFVFVFVFSIDEMCSINPILPAKEGVSKKADSTAEFLMDWLRSKVEAS